MTRRQDGAAPSSKRTAGKAEPRRDVRKVTAWGSVGLAWTVIVGLYGMNFTHMPELSWTWGYPAVLAVMAMVGIILVVFFRRHGWLRVTPAKIASWDFGKLADLV